MTLIDETFLAKVADAMPASGRLAFRGLADSNWNLHSGATRRILQELGGNYSAEHERSLTFGKLYLSYHRGVLLEAARNYGFDMPGGRRDSDLQLLSKLQHLGAATGLMDFTWDSLVALWFATSIPKGRQCSGKVVVVNLNDTTQFTRFTKPPNEQTLVNLFPLTTEPTEPQFYWEPKFQDEAGNRVLRQRSVFVIGCPTGQEVPIARVSVEIEIPSKEKEIIRRELESLFGVSEQSLFPDVHGFAGANSHSVAITRLYDPEYFESQGSELYQRGEYERSIIAYDECIGLDPSRWRTYYLRANAKAQHKDFLEAKNDYAVALRLLISATENQGTAVRVAYKFFIFMASFNRGNMNYNLGEYNEACTDYEKGMHWWQGREQGVLRYNRANAKAKLGHFEAALEEYDHAIQANVKFSKFNKGNILVAMGRFREALQCYLDEQEQRNSEQTNNNASIMHEVISRIGDRKGVVTIYEPEGTIVSGMATVTVFENEEAQQKHKTLPKGKTEDDGAGKTFVCSGNAGNVGNFGGGDTKGGDGSPGGDGFLLRITW